MENIFRSFHKFWTEERSLTVLFVILCLNIFIVMPFGEHTVPAKLTMMAFYIVLLSAGMPFLVKKVLLRDLFIFLLGILFILGSGLIFQSPLFKILEDFSYVIYCSSLSFVVLVRTFRKGPITIHRVQGAVVVFLLISLVFAMLYHSMILLGYPDAFTGLSAYDRKELLYFSLSTLTTTGYGDIAPVSPIARSLANMEALTGMLYPVMLIARLVSLSQQSSGSDQ